MNVRKAVVGDLPVVVDFILEEASEAEGRRLDRDTLEVGIGRAFSDDSLARYWLMVDDEGKAGGCISVVREWSDWNAGFYWWIQSLYLAPEFRGKGHLNRMIEAVAYEARASDCIELRLYVHRSNEAAVRAYGKIKFETSPYVMMHKPL